MLGAVIFDMDGLLVDSEPFWVRAEIEVFRTAGLELREEDCARTKGLRIDDLVRYWHERRPWATPSPREIEQRIVARVAEMILEGGRALPGVSSALAAARGVTSRVALASSSAMPIIRAVLSRLALEGAFDVVISAESEPFGKPHPGVFLTTADKLGVPATSCVVLEDSLTGVLAAKSARMACVAVPERFPEHDPRFAIADTIVGSLERVTPALLRGLV